MPDVSQPAARLHAGRARDGAARTEGGERSQQFLRILTYNTHLFGSCLAGAQTCADRGRAAAFCAAISALEPLPDVVCLSEVWAADAAEQLRAGLLRHYPHALCGPMRSPLRYVVPGAAVAALGVASLLHAPLTPVLLGLAGATAVGTLGAALAGEPLGSGLLVLSRHPFEGAARFMPFAARSGEDALSQKGALLCRLSTPAGPVAVVNTHLQAHARHRGARSLQVRQLAQLTDSFRDEHPGVPLFAAGDFNVVGEQDGGAPTGHYLEMLAVLRLRDASRCEGAACEPAVTYDGRENALIRRFRRFIPNHDRERLDYVLFEPQPGAGTRVRCRKAHVVRFAADYRRCGREEDLSDHYGVMASFEIARGG